MVETPRHLPSFRSSPSKRGDRNRDGRDKDRDRGKDRAKDGKDGKGKGKEKDAKPKDKEKPKAAAGGGVDLLSKLAAINARVTGVPAVVVSKLS